MSLTPAAVLKKARELISDEKAWTKGTLARDAFGNSVHWSREDATCFCASGAVLRSAGAYHREAFNFLDDAVGSAMVIPGWNDAPERTHAEVLAAFDKAIASAEAGGGE